MPITTGGNYSALIEITYAHAYIHSMPKAEWNGCVIRGSKEWQQKNSTDCETITEFRTQPYVTVWSQTTVKRQPVYGDSSTPERYCGIFNTALMRAAGAEKVVTGVKYTRVSAESTCLHRIKYSPCWRVSDKLWRPSARKYTYKKPYRLLLTSWQLFPHPWMSSLTNNWHLRMALMFIRRVPSWMDLRCCKRRKHLTMWYPQTFTRPPQIHFLVEPLLHTSTAGVESYSFTGWHTTTYHSR